MDARRTMTLNLSEAEMRSLGALCAKRQLTKTALLRQALRMYQEIDARLEHGNKLLVEDRETKDKLEIMIL